MIPYSIISVSNSRSENIANIIDVMGEPLRIKCFDISNKIDVDEFLNKYANFNIDEYLNDMKYQTNPARRDGEIGCWMSHYNAWNYLVENNLNEMIVIEDDCLIDRDKFEFILNDIEGNSYSLYLAGQWAEFYYLDRATAEILLTLAFHHGFRRMPVDEFLFDAVREFGIKGKFGANIVSQINQWSGSEMMLRRRAVS